MLSSIKNSHALTSTPLFEHVHIPGTSSSNNGAIRQALKMPSSRNPSSSSRLQFIGNSIWSCYWSYQIPLRYDVVTRCMDGRAATMSKSMEVHDLASRPALLIKKKKKNGPKFPHKIPWRRLKLKASTNLYALRHWVNDWCHWIHSVNSNKPHQYFFLRSKNFRRSSRAATSTRSTRS